LRDVAGARVADIVDELSFHADHYCRADADYVSVARRQLRVVNASMVTSCCYHHAAPVSSSAACLRYAVYSPERYGDAMPL